MKYRGQKIHYDGFVDYDTVCDIIQNLEAHYKLKSINPKYVINNASKMSRLHAATYQILNEYLSNYNCLIEKDNVYLPNNVKDDSEEFFNVM